jgi:hypothetical protein
VALLLAACGDKGPPIGDDSGLPWVEHNGVCVRQSETGPLGRVINRVDPELCGRYVKHRPNVYVRIVPPPGTRSP